LCREHRPKSGHPRARGKSAAGPAFDPASGTARTALSGNGFSGVSGPTDGKTGGGGLHRRSVGGSNIPAS
jgi:hypothetical protein